VEVISFDNDLMSQRFQSVWSFVGNLKFDFFCEWNGTPSFFITKKQGFHDFFSFFQYCLLENKLKNFKLIFSQWTQSMVGLNIFFGRFDKKIWLNNLMLTSTFCLGRLKIFKSVSHSLWSSFTIMQKYFVFDFVSLT